MRTKIRGPIQLTAGKTSTLFADHLTSSLSLNSQRNLAVSRHKWQCHIRLAS
jgi:hypothetical protein